MGWHQGWNDIPELSAKAYGQNLKNLVEDVRSALHTPALPFVIANTGQGGIEGSKKRSVLIEQQKSITDPSSANFVEDVRHIDTRGMWREASVSPKEQNICRSHIFSYKTKTKRRAKL
jgi:hypothetical protein